MIESRSFMSSTRKFSKAEINEAWLHECLFWSLLQVFCPCFWSGIEDIPWFNPQDTGEFLMLFCHQLTFFKDHFFPKLSFMNTISMSNDWFRSGTTFCQSWYGSKLFVKATRRWQRSPTWILWISVHIHNSMKLCPFVLMISSRNEILTSINGQNSAINLQISDRSQRRYC